jgi:Na+/H+-dicarboxylate symporter
MRGNFTNFKKVFFSLPAKLIVIIFSTFLLGDLLPESIKSVFLTTSLVMKDVLLFLLPIIIFFLVFASFASLSGRLLLFTGLLLSLICFSNFSAVMVSYSVGSLTKNFIAAIAVETQQIKNLQPYFTPHIPKTCDNFTAIILGIVFGIYASAKNNLKMKSAAAKSVQIVNTFLTRIFTPVLPLFILGFILKAQHDGSLNNVFKNFVPLLSVILSIFVIYIGSLYFIICECNVKRMLTAIKNISPAGLVGFSSMSSAAAMPSLIDGAIKNAVDKNVPRSIIPFVTNTHIIGDALTIPLMAMSIYVLEYNQLPSVYMYFIFAIGYTLAKFAAAGVPGGTIIIMIPVLESKLGFSSEMSSLILATYLLFDPFCTCGNIFGNGAFAMLFEKLKAHFAYTHSEF